MNGDWEATHGEDVGAVGNWEAERALFLGYRFFLVPTIVEEWSAWGSGCCSDRIEFERERSDESYEA